MKACWIFLNLIMTAAALGQTQPALDSLPHPNIGKLTLDSHSVTVLHLRPGYVSYVRLPEEVSSVVLGDARSFKAEHSEAEPRLVFLKPLTSKAGETNALITTKSGHEVPLHLISNGKSDGGDVDFLLDYERPHSFLIPSAQPSFVVAESKSLNSDSSPPVTGASEVGGSVPKELLRQINVAAPEWKGKQLQVAVGEISGNAEQMTVAFSVLNNSAGTVELLPPQVQLSGPSKQLHGNKTKADQVAVYDYTLTLRKLGPGARADGVVVFERPAFKESSEQLLLQIAQAEQVDHPVLVPVAFTAPIKRQAQ